jgi:hypothetical protein
MQTKLQYYYEAAELQTRWIWRVSFISHYTGTVVIAVVIGQVLFRMKK